MLNHVKILTNVSSVNQYNVVSTLDVRADSYTLDFYIQLWQSDMGIRYVPAAAATITIEFLRSDTVALVPVSQKVSKSATAPFAAVTAGGADDRSIWKATLTQAEVAKITTGGFRVIVTEGTQVRTLWSDMVIRKLPSSETCL